MVNYWFDVINETLRNYSDVVNQVFTLDVKDCGDKCILRVVNWNVIRNIRNIYALMIDPDDFQELMKRPSLIKELLSKNLRRLILYPCFGNNELLVLHKLGFIAMNYITRRECPHTEDVVIPPNAYDAVQLVNEGVRVYVHLYQPFTRQRQIPRGLFNDFFEYLRRYNVRVNLIVERFPRS